MVWLSKSTLHVGFYVQISENFKHLFIFDNKDNKLMIRFSTVSAISSKLKFANEKL